MRLKNIPRLRLFDLLRRRRVEFNQFLAEFGITTYEGLVIRCARMGVLPPADHEFMSACPASAAPAAVNNPPEGVVVIEPLPAEETLGAETDQVEPTTALPEQLNKKQKKKKEPATGA